jgi:acetylornithine deacetylase/succinyl-diaminopimelate desuccinylase-like protein
VDDKLLGGEKMNDPINWKSNVDEAIQNIVRLVQVETVNPPGNELPAILVVKDILEKAGFPEADVTIVEAAPNRANLVARLRGDGSQRPLLLSGHVDVVPVERDKWTHDPFGGEIINGEIWGRGTADMKGFLGMYLQVFLMLFRQGLPLKRDIILAAIADEEAGMLHGSHFLVNQHPELIDAEYGLTEGGAMTVELGKLRTYPIQVAEKGICWMVARTRGEPGHGSTPNPDSAVLRLASALERLRKAGHLPVHLTPTVRQMLKAALGQSGFPASAMLPVLNSEAVVNGLLNRLSGSTRALLVALTTNTVSPNMLNAGVKENVIPSVAEVTLDCRTLPGQTAQDVMREVKAIMGEEIELEEVVSWVGPEFPMDTELYRLLVRHTQKMDPTGTVMPMLMPGATDAHEYQRAGIKVYGFTPGIMPPQLPILRLAHGHDERLPVSYIETGLPTLWNVVNEFCTL